MKKHAASLKALVVLGLGLAFTGTQADFFEFCNSGHTVIFSQCEPFCLGYDKTCRKNEGYAQWCETGWGICMHMEDPVNIEWTYKEYYCTPYFGGQCHCIEGTVIDEGVTWATGWLCMEV